MSDLQRAIDAIKANYPVRSRLCNYYDGGHDLTFATEKYKTTFGMMLRGMRDNLCPIVVDAPADRMEVLNFSGDETDKAVADAAWKLWLRETLELTSHEVHIEAIKTGCGYLIVWPGPDGAAKPYKQDSRNCVVIEDDETGEPLFGAKLWDTADKHVRLNLYYADRIEKYITSKKREGESAPLKTEAFVAYEGGRIPNPYGVVPMFAFETQPALIDAIPVQDALNKTYADRLVAQEFGAFRQRWATGLEPPTDEISGIPTLPFKAGVDRLWFTAESTVKFGEFSATDLEPYLKAADSDRLEMARVTGTPLHFFSINTSDAISGEALKTLESRFTKKVRRLTLNFGTVWAKAMKLALQIEGQSADNITVQWQSPEQRSEKEVWETLGLKADLGVPEEVCWEEAGYTEEDIAKFKKLAAEQPESPDTSPVVNMAGQPVDNNGVPITNGSKTAKAA